MLHNNRDTIKGVAADDRADLIDLLHRFAMAIDTRDWVAYRAVFTDEIDLDYSSWNPDSLGRWTADDWVAKAQRLFPGLTWSRHALTNPIVAIEGDQALVRVNVSADHVIVDDGTPAVFTLHGRYEDTCVRTDNGWRITGKRLIVQWCIGDDSVMTIARARAAAAGDS